MTQITYTLLHPGGGEGSTDDKVFVCCPACGVRIFRVSSCSNAEHLCPKCGVHLSVDVEGGMCGEQPQKDCIAYLHCPQL